MQKTEKSSRPTLKLVFQLAALLAVAVGGFTIARSKIRRGYQLFELTPESRELVLSAYPPKFKDILADHITFQYGVSSTEIMPLTPQTIEVKGYIADDSLECLIVAVNGNFTRMDGKVFHITLSKAPHRKANESNSLITKYGWIERSGPALKLQAIPKYRSI